MTTGLRERRKQEARRSISGVAMALFADRGFDEVTIPQVADAAGVSKMTVTNYFPRKEDLVFDRADATIRSLADAVDARARGESLLAAIRRDFAERMAAGDVTLGVPTATFAGWSPTATCSPAGDGRSPTSPSRRSATPSPPTPARTHPQHRIVAAELASVHRVLFAEGTRRVLAGQPRDEICQALAAAASRAFDLLEPSLGDYGSRC